jgi:YidC/Oxa1 family membrane protein insertase
MILGSVITSIISPFADVFGQVLAFFYGFTHSYGLSIILLTLAVMVLVFPLTRAGTRSMMRMQILQPELKKIQAKYKAKPGMTTEERQENRVKLNEEMMALYRQNGVNPTGGCLPMFLQFPIFIVLYDTIRGMTRTITTGHGAHAKSVLSPQYIPKKSALYNAVLHSHGVLGFLGLNLTDSVRSPGGIASKIPYGVVILVAVVLQYVSIWQITTRNPAAAQANPQMQAVQKFMPLIFVVFYIVLPAGVGVYFIVSSLFRIGQQEYMYKHDPKIQESIKEIRRVRAASAPGSAKQALAKPTAPSPGGSDGGRPARPTLAAGVGDNVAGERKGFRERLRDARAGFKGELGAGEEAGAPAAPAGGGSGGVGRPPASRAAGQGSSRNGAVRSATNGSQVANPQPTGTGSRNRSRDKRPRR